MTPRLPMLLYQGMTSVVPIAPTKDEGLSPCALILLQTFTLNPPEHDVAGIATPDAFVSGHDFSHADNAHKR